MSPPIREQVLALHEQLVHVHSVDEDTHEVLITLLSDITRLLGPSSVTESVGERLEELAVRFENEHPALGTALRQAIDVLAKAGI